MPHSLNLKRIGNLNRGVYNSITMIYKVRGAKTSLVGYNSVLTVKDKQWDDSPGEANTKFVVQGLIDTEEPWRVFFPITAQQSQLDPRKPYFGDIVITGADGVPLRKALLTFGVTGGPNNSNSGNTATDGAAGSAVVVNDCGHNVVVVDVFSGERGKTGPGVMAGGTTDQVLVKASDADFDTKWANSVVRDVGWGEIQGNLSDQTDLKNALDSNYQAISEEATTRAMADSNLSSAIDTEATVRESADSDLADSISDEATAREAADTNLATAISTEVARAEGVEGTLSDALGDKLDKVTDQADLDRAYVVTGGDKGAQQTTYEIDQAAATEGTIARRGDYGEVKTAYPEQDEDAANKEYVDDKVGDEATARASAVGSLGNALANEVTRAGQAEQDLASDIADNASAIADETSRAEAAEADAKDYTDTKTAGLDTSVLTGLDISEASDANNVEFTITSKNLSTGNTSSTIISDAPIASDEQTGFMPKESMAAIEQMQEDIAVLQGDTPLNYLVTFPSDTPTQNDCQTLYETASGKTGEALESTTLFDSVRNMYAKWYTSDDIWVIFAGGSGSGTTQVATNSSLGVVRGDATTPGKQYVEADGSLSTNGWDTLTTSVGNKVDKVSGKGLSTNDYTTTEKNKLAGIAAGAEVNVQPDWNQATTTADDYIKNKPTIPTQTSQLTNNSNFVSDASYVHTDNNYTSTEKTKLGGIAAGAEVNVQANWTQTSTGADDYIKNKPTLATVATSGSYNDLSNKPSPYSLPTASTTTLGGIKLGSNLAIDSNGVVRAVWG